MFQYYQPTKIHYGAGSLEELGIICRPYGKKAFLVTTPDVALQPLYARVTALLKHEKIEVVHFDQIEPNPGVEMLEEGFTRLKKTGADFVLAVGGGSSMDSAKTLAFTYGVDHIDWDMLFQEFTSPFTSYPSLSGHLPLISVPTTSGTGSQVTQAAVITRGNEKITYFHPDNFSKECIIDPELTLTLPSRMSAATGFDAFTHAFESYLNNHASYYSIMDSMEAMKLIIEHLPCVLQEPSNLEHRSYMCLADTMAGKALANSGAAAPHPLSEIIGGITHLPHGEALAVVMPSFIKHSPQFKEKFEKVAALFGSNDLYEGMCDFLKKINLYKKLSDFNVTKEQFEEILASPVLAHLPFASKEELITILQDAYA